MSTSALEIITTSFFRKVRVTFSETSAKSFSSIEEAFDAMNWNIDVSKKPPRIPLLIVAIGKDGSRWGIYFSYEDIPEGALDPMKLSDPKWRAFYLARK